VRIAITGSWRRQDQKKWGLRDEPGFLAALESIGAELVRLGHRLVVASDASFTADGAAVAGALRSLPREGVYNQPVVDLVRNNASAFADLAVKRPGFVNPRSVPANRKVTKLHQVHLADVVLAAGGADKTLQAVVAAAISGKRVVPLGCFGGAGAQAVKVFETSAEFWGPHVPPSDVLGPLAMPWASQSLELVLSALGARYPRILIVHGRDLQSRDALDKLLVDLGLPKPVIMAAEPTLGRALPEKFEQLAVKVDAAIALVTPDDLGGLRDAPSPAFSGRARQNVWVEVGWFWGRLGRARMLLLGKKGVEVPSDLAGLLIGEFEDSPATLAPDICSWIESLGWPRPTPRPNERPTP
jgi:hypothetical protein